MLLGCGLWRRELADLEFTHLQQREEHWAIVDLIGKGGHIWTVPAPGWVKATIDLWVSAAGVSTGRLFRCVCRAGKTWGDMVSERVVWHVVKQYAKAVGLAQVVPHDLRRSCAKARIRGLGARRRLPGHVTCVSCSMSASAIRAHGLSYLLLPSISIK